MQFELKSTCGMALHNILGRQGEDLAVAFLRGKGLQILDRNWKLGDLETDIVAKQDDELVFVEVKYSSTRIFGEPMERVDAFKQHQIIKAAEGFIHKNQISMPCRFDVISIVGDEITHIENAFEM